MSQGENSVSSSTKENVTGHSALKTVFYIVIGAVVFGLTLIGGGWGVYAYLESKKDSDAYAVAEKKGDRSDFESYLAKLPEGKHASEAKRSIENLYWKAIPKNLRGYIDYLESYPNGAHVSEAREQADKLAWNEYGGKGISGMRKYLGIFPSGNNAELAKSKIEKKLSCNRAFAQHELELVSRGKGGIESGSEGAKNVYSRKQGSAYSNTYFSGGTATSYYHDGSYTHPLPHNSSRMNCLHRFNASDEAADSCEALPERFNAGFPIPFSGKESAEHGDAADDLAQGGRFPGRLLFGQPPGGLPFDLVKHFAGGQFRMEAPQPYQMGQSPGDDPIEGQSPLQFLDMPQLQRFDAATVLEHMKQGFDFPTAAIPIDQFSGLRQSGDGPVAQQTPFDRFLSWPRTALAGDQTGHRHEAALAVGPFHGTGIKCLAHGSCGSVGSLGRNKFVNVGFPQFPPAFFAATVYTLFARLAPGDRIAQQAPVPLGGRVKRERGTWQGNRKAPTAPATVSECRCAEALPPMESQPLGRYVASWTKHGARTAWEGGASEFGQSTDCPNSPRESGDRPVAGTARVVWAVCAIDLLRGAEGGQMYWGLIPDPFHRHPGRRSGEGV
jgi:hypothetical protein